MYRLPAFGIRQNFPPSDEGRTKTLAGQRKYTTEYRDQWLCLTHYPDVEVAESFLTSKDGGRNWYGILLWSVRES